jgi:hypothetical protein
MQNLNINIPIFNTPDKPIERATWQHLPVADVTDNLFLFKDGGAALVMESSSLNFGLLSYKEQEAVIASYAAFINSLTFSVQIMVRSQRKDISTYMKYVSEQEKKLTNPKLQGLMAGYKQFIFDSIKKKKVLGKRFYIVIPFSSLEMGVSKSIASATKRSGPLPYTKSYLVKKAKIILYPRRDHLVRQAGRLGIKLKQLTNEQLITLLYDFYNQEAPVTKKEEEVGQNVK